MSALGRLVNGELVGYHNAGPPDDRAEVGADD